MTIPQRPATEYWTVRIGMPATFVLLISSTEPVVSADKRVTWTPIPGYGDTLAYMDWDAVLSIAVHHFDATKAVADDTAPVKHKSKSKRKGKSKDAEPSHVVSEQGDRVTPSDVMAKIERAALRANPRIEGITAEQAEFLDKMRADHVALMVKTYWRKIDTASD